MVSTFPSTSPVFNGAIQASTPTPYPLRVYYVAESSYVLSATTIDGSSFTAEEGVRLSSATSPQLGVSISSITGVTVLPMPTSGYFMLYSVIADSHGALDYQIDSATSSDGLNWANTSATAAVVDGGSSYLASPNLVELSDGEWRLYYIRAGSVVGNGAIYTSSVTSPGQKPIFGEPAVALNVNASQVAASTRTDGLVRLYYATPVSGSADTEIASALSMDANGTFFTAEPGVRASTSSFSGTLAWPFVMRSTNSYEWRLYYDYLPSGKLPPQEFTALSVAPAPAAINPDSAYNTESAATFTIGGDVFSPGVTAQLSNGTNTLHDTAINYVNDVDFAATFDLQGAAVGSWNLIVTNADGNSATLYNALHVTFPPGYVTLKDNLLKPAQGGATTISVTIFNPGNIVVKIYTLIGMHEVATVFDGYESSSGTYPFTWNGTTSRGDMVASGVYIARVIGPKLDSLNNKIVVIK
jgi:hypothetical protein